MKSFLITSAVIFSLSIATLTACAQDNKTAKQLVDEGVALNDSGSYAQAAEKYSAALKADPAYLRADYELGYTLYISGKGLDAVPYLEKVVAQPGALNAQTYDLLGSVYDDNKQPDKAIDCYKKGIAADSKYERLHFNLGISYLRQKQYDEGEAEEIEAIRLDPKHASAQRMYAIAEYEKGNYTHSLIIWCSFLMLEPQSSRSIEAFNYIRAIINKGITYKDAKNININVSAADMRSEEMMTRLGIVAATEGKDFESNKRSAVDTLTAQLKSVFEVSAGRNEKDTGFYANYFAKYFGLLAASDNMPAFGRLISMAAYKDENIAWFKENKKQLDDLSNWIQLTTRSF